MEKVKPTRKKAGIHITTLLTTLFISTIILANAQPTLYANPLLNLTVTADKQTYGIGEKIHINGTLTSDGSPIQDALVAIEIRDSAELPFTFRTRPTGIITQTDWPVNYTELFPCDSNGNPKYSFKTGTNLWIRFTIKNHDITSHNVLAAISVYDADTAPFGAWYPYSGSIEPGKSVTVIFMADKIPSNAKLGDATIYANIYSDFPGKCGFPYCPEKTATFTITGSTTSSSTTPSQTSEYISQTLQGTYNLTFNLPPKDIRVGNYTLYASTIYRSEQAFAYTTFEVILIGDINGDKIVDVFDAVLLAKAAGSTPGSPNWDPRCDLNNDGIVDLFDAVLLAANAGKTAL